MNRNYSPTIHGYMNTRRGKTRFKSFQILLDSGYSYMIVMRRLMTKLKTKDDSVIQWHTQSGNITTNTKVKIYFTLPGFTTKKIVTWNKNVNDYAKGRYDMILVRDILTALVPNKKLSEHAIKVYYGTLKGSTAPMVDLVTYEFKGLNIGKITPDESFIKTYMEEVYE